LPRGSMLLKTKKTIANTITAKAAVTIRRSEADHTFQKKNSFIHFI
jgi:hypothetical protein